MIIIPIVLVKAHDFCKDHAYVLISGIWKLQGNRSAHYISRIALKLIITLRNKNILYILVFLIRALTIITIIYKVSIKVWVIIISFRLVTEDVAAVRLIPKKLKIIMKLYHSYRILSLTLKLHVHVYGTKLFVIGRFRHLELGY